jgi:hypothetical protein
LKPILVTSQAEYDNAQKTYQDALDKSSFDIDMKKGMEIVEEVDYLIYNFLCNGISKADTEKSLSRFYFTQSQAREITDYFLTHQPGDLYEIERGLNILNFSPDREMNKRISPIQIRDGVEKIKVYYPVEVFGNSHVEIFGHARVVAHDAACITAYDQAIVEAFDTAKVTAFDQSHVTARNTSAVTLFSRSSVAAYNHASLSAGDHAKAAVFDEASARVSQYAKADAYDHTYVTAGNMTKIRAYQDATVIARDYTRVTAQDTSYIVAKGFAAIDAEDNAVVAAGDAVTVNAKHHALVFTRDDARCEYTGEARLITSVQNKPLFLKSNVLKILNHPYIDREPVIAVNLLLSSANPGDREAFSQKLKEMGCIDPESTNRVLTALANEFESKLRKERRRGESWER